MDQVSNIELKVAAHCGHDVDGRHRAGTGDAR